MFPKGYTFKILYSVIIGSGLKQSIEVFLSQLPKPTVEANANLISNLVIRLTRISIIAFFVAFMPTVLLYLQNQKIDRQNELFLDQNKRLVQQTYLQEAERRSSVNFLVSSVLDGINDELKLSNNKERKLSDELIGRIASLSFAMKPYHYLKRDALTKKELSPERGQLMITLLNSNINKGTMNKIFGKSNFTNADMDEVPFSGFDLSSYTIFNVSLREAKIIDCNIIGTEFAGCDMELSTIALKNDYTNFMSCNLKEAKFKGSYERNKTHGHILSKANLDSTVFQSVSLSNFYFGEQDISTVFFHDCKMKNDDIKSVFPNNVTGIKKMMTRHRIEKKSGEFYLTYKKDN